MQVRVLLTSSRFRCTLCLHNFMTRIKYSSLCLNFNLFTVFYLKLLLHLVFRNLCICDTPLKDVYRQQVLAESDYDTTVCSHVFVIKWWFIVLHMSSICMYVTARDRLNGLSWNFISECLREFVGLFQFSLIRITAGISHEDLHSFLRIEVTVWAIAAVICKDEMPWNSSVGNPPSGIFPRYPQVKSHSDERHNC